MADLRELPDTRQTPASRGGAGFKEFLEASAEVPDDIRHFVSRKLERYPDE